MSINIELLVIGGGGAGGLSNPNSLEAGGGGGAGEAVYKPSFSVPTGTPITIIVGALGIATGTRGNQFGNTADGGESLFYIGPTNMVVASGGGAGGSVGTYGQGGVVGNGDSGYCGGGGAGGGYPNAQYGGGGVAYGGFGYPGYGSFGCGGGGGGSLPQAGTNATSTVAGAGGVPLSGYIGGLPFPNGGGGGGGGSNGAVGGIGQGGGGSGGGGNTGGNGTVGNGYGSGGGGAGADNGYGTLAGNGTVGLIMFSVPTGTLVTFTGTSGTQTNGGNTIYSLFTGGTLTIGSGGGGSGGPGVLPGLNTGPGCCCSGSTYTPCPTCSNCPTSYTFTVSGFNSDHSVYNNLTIQVTQLTGCVWTGNATYNRNTMQGYFGGYLACSGALPFLIEVGVDIIDPVTPPYSRYSFSSYLGVVPADSSGRPILGSYVLTGGGYGDAENTLMVTVTTP